MLGPLGMVAVGVSRSRAAGAQPKQPTFAEKAVTEKPSPSQSYQDDEAEAISIVDPAVVMVTVEFVEEEEVEIGGERCAGDRPGFRARAFLLSSARLPAGSASRRSVGATGEFLVGRAGTRPRPLRELGLAEARLQGWRCERRRCSARGEDRGRWRVLPHRDAASRSLKQRPARIRAAREGGALRVPSPLAPVGGRECDRLTRQSGGDPVTPDGTAVDGRLALRSR